MNNNYKVAVFAVVSLLSVSWSAAAAGNCFQKSPLLDSEGYPIVEVNSRTLSRAEYRDLKGLLKQTAGRWRGTATGYFCLGKEDAPRIKRDDFTIEVDSEVDSSGNMRLSAAFTTLDRSTSRSEGLNLFVSSRGLRLDYNNRSGNVEILEVSRASIEFVHAHRLATRGSGAIGGSLPRQLLKKIDVSGSSMTVHHEVYIGGVLTSGSTWSLRRN